jgi:hypothetical protein
MPIEPRIDVLPKAQAALWPFLEQVPPEFVLYGGTAVALRYGHRFSEDFDFFTNAPVALNELQNNIPIIKETVVKIELIGHNQLNIKLFIKNLDLSNDDSIVKVTFLSDKKLIPGCIIPPDICLDNNIKIASPIDLLATKILAL